MPQLIIDLEVIKRDGRETVFLQNPITKIEYCFLRFPNGAIEKRYIRLNSNLTNK